MPRKSRRQRLASQRRRHSQSPARPVVPPAEPAMVTPPRETVGPVSPPPAAPRPGAARPGPRSGARALPDYSYVGRDVRRLVILAAVLFALLALLAVALD